jgi:glycosyltransferase involved in cell wall biosynthesis
MRILLVHRNFPGQFRYLAPQLIKAGHKVGVLTWEENPNPQPLPHMKYPNTLGPMKGIGDTYNEYAKLGASAAKVAWEYRKKTGEVPDVVFGIINWGETLFLKEVWPEARHLGYAEFMYQTRGADTGFDPEFSRDDFAGRVRVLGRRAHLMQAALQADALMSPTRWQASTFPAELQSKMHVIHDGVDTDRIAPLPMASFRVPDGPILRMGDEVLTFVNRNLEPYRGYHILMRALPKIMAARPDLHVVMVGGEGPGYGPVPAADKSWKQFMHEELGDRVDWKRLHYTGRIPYEDLLNLLRVGRAHAYLTYPFVLSWSMMEAMSLGCMVVGSATKPVMELIEDGVTGRLVDFFDVEGWADTLIDVLANPEKHAPMREAARRHIVDNYDLKTRCLPRLMQFVETAGT